ncbi:MAG: 30S ribosomal protein S4 [Candidatus Aenigmarchaeota archaeon]|nr:30S ribosomal protein S4 [Candidatus Aenigmarchaeota archaeon]
MRNLRRRFKRPKVPYNTAALEEGRATKRKFGLRRKKEIWTTQETLRRFRQRARELIAIRNKEQETILLEKLFKIGVLEKGASLDDVLGLTVEHFLNRRLQTVVLAKGMAKTARQARQAIVHGHITIDGRIVTFPSYVVAREEEGQIASTFAPPETKKAVPAPEGSEAQEAAS